MTCKKPIEPLPQGENGFDSTHEVISIEKTLNVCPLCEDYVHKNAANPIAIMSCEGACLRGEIARRAANILSYTLAPEKTVRICLGGAFTTDTGQRGLVRNASKVIAIEGCFINCCSRMMKGVIPRLEPQVIIADGLYDFDTSLFSIDEMSEKEIKAHAQEVAQKVYESLDVSAPAKKST